MAARLAALAASHELQAGDVAQDAGVWPVSHRFGGHLHAQVATGHHQGVGLGHDGVECRDGRGLFQLGDDARLAGDQAATSSGRCTKDSATQSTPSFRPNSRSRRSFSVRADRGSTTPGTLTPCGRRADRR
jgi:hypothetical protein